jgi:hypothetical protein
MEKEAMSTTLELKSLVAQVDKKKPPEGAIKALRQFLDDNPGIWRNIGDLAEQANLAMIADMKASTAQKETIKHGLGVLERELTQPGDGPLEKLIIRQITGCWLRLSYVEYVVNTNTVEGNFNMAQGAYWEKRLSAGQRRYLRAIETLARVRRLQLPAMQVNIGNQQVNQVR